MAGRGPVTYGLDVEKLGIRRIDVARSAVLAAAQIAGTIGAAQGQPDRRGLDAAAIVLLVAGPAFLLVWRRLPLVSLGGVVAVTLAYLIADYPYGPVVLSVVIALVVAVVQGHRMAAWAAVAALYGVHFGVRAATDVGDGVTGGQMIGVGAWLIVILSVAEVVRVRTERRADAIRVREEEVLRQASEERLRIARELHDVLAHNISLINVQAGVALHVMDEQPEQVRTSLKAIRQASGEALREVRATLEVLRGVHEGAPRTPAPGLADIEELAARSSAGGLRVVTEVTGARRPLPAAVDRAAFRIVQEAVTNVHRHAGASTATVRVDYGDELTVQVDDDGRGGPPADDAAGGRGIVGMRERAAAAGGHLEAGPRPEGGFRVRARLPLEDAS